MGKFKNTPDPEIITRALFLRKFQFHFSLLYTIDNGG